MSVYFAQKNSVIVDVGTSTGVLLSDLNNINKNRNVSCVGLDIEKDMIALASPHFNLPSGILKWGLARATLL